jgi:magnesium transporter
VEKTRIGEPSEVLAQLVEAGDTDGVRSFLESVSSLDLAHAISRLDREDQSRLLLLLEPEHAAAVVVELPEAQGADLIEQLPPDRAASILDSARSDHQADLLAQVPETTAEAILERMSPEEATDARQLLEYPPDTAGGMMITEFLAYPGSATVGEIIADLHNKGDEYADHAVLYLYVTDRSGHLQGVLRMRDLVFSRPSVTLSEVMIPEPWVLDVNASLDEVREFFERRGLLGVPIVDGDGRLLGIVRRSAVEETAGQKATRQFLGVSGIVGGEEFRTMPMLVRSGRRLSWLTINIFLNIIAASVIAVYTDTLAAAIALAVFLPIISDMSGCSGNQAVAVSMRELTLGLVRPNEVARVILKELGVGALNGVVLGVAFLWQGNAFLGLVVGSALAANTVLAVCLGGTLPLVMKRLRLDPALVSGPVLTTVTDMCGFFLVLGLATLMLSRL